MDIGLYEFGFRICNLGYKYVHVWGYVLYSGSRSASFKTLRQKLV
jgi:hypothetical protein